MAMTLALESPALVSDIVAVDNAPVDAALQSEFPVYIRGMQKVDDAHVKKQSEADAILQEYAKVRSGQSRAFWAES